MAKTFLASNDNLTNAGYNGDTVATVLDDPTRRRLFAMYTARAAMRLWAKGLKSRRFTPATIAQSFRLKAKTAAGIVAELDEAIAQIEG